MSEWGLREFLPPATEVVPSVPAPQPPAVAFQDEAVTLYQGNALQGLIWLAASGMAGMVDACVTDPPYSSGGTFRGDRTQATSKKYFDDESVASSSVADFMGDNRDQRSYQAWTVWWMEQVLQLLTPGGVLAAFCDWRQAPTISDALQLAGAVWRGTAVWHKPNGRRFLSRFGVMAEYIQWGTRGPRGEVEGVGALPSVFTHSTQVQGKVHQTQKPLALMEQLCAIAPPGGLILDPFAGSGTTLLAARNTGRRAIGFELSPEIAAVAAARLRDAPPALVVGDVADTARPSPASAPPALLPLLE